MKKNTLLYFITAMALCSCNNGNNSEKKESDTSKEEVKTEENIITKTVPLMGEFTHITAVTGANIIYTQGNQSMEITGDSSFIQTLKPDIDSGVLTISMGSELNSDLDLFERNHNVTINISAPSLKCVTICSSGNFTSKGLWTGDKIEFGIIGTGNFTCDSIECKMFDFQSSGSGNAAFAHIKAETIHVANSRGSNVTANINTDVLKAENVGNSTFSFNGKANTKELYPTTNGKIEFK